MIEIALEQLRTSFGFGVAGNFAGHLEQAGEASDFVSVQAAAGAPKGIFPWYVPGEPSTQVPEFLHVFPLSNDTTSFPAGSDNLQIEPEVGLVAHVRYDGDGRVQAILPTAIGAFNDCSIRRVGGVQSKKISEKKNWGAASKGVAARFFPVTDLEADTVSTRLASFLVRDGETHAYGQDSALAEYSYYGTRLLDWIVERLNNQQGAPDTPLEPVGGYLADSGRPERLLIGIGATRYTAFGEATFLRLGDEAVVVVYDGAVHTPAQVQAAVAAGASPERASVLRQRVVGA